MSDMEIVRDKFITFQTGEEHYGLRIECVSEIIAYQEYTQIPESADYIKGLINLRGKIIPVIDVRLRFRQEPFEYNDRTVIIVICINDMTVGLIVEKITEVVELTAEDILQSPSISKTDNSANKYVFGIGRTDNGVKLLLDPLKLIQDVEESNKEEGLALEDKKQEVE